MTKIKAKKCRQQTCVQAPHIFSIILHGMHSLKRQLKNTDFFLQSIEMKWRQTLQFSLYKYGISTGGLILFHHCTLLVTNGYRYRVSGSGPQ